MKTKYKAFVSFKEVKEEIEVEKNVKVKALRTDWGGEFRSFEFDEYCKTIGIKRYLTTPYSPQQNGVVERRNQIILRMIRSMMKSMYVLLEFWGEAITTVVYILNRASTKSLTGRTPYEAWYERKPKVEHLRNFRCPVHVKVTNPHISKFDDMSSLMVFIGYEKGSKAYRVYNPITRKVHVIRDAIFEEDKAWSWDTGEGHTSIGFRIDHGHDELGSESGDENQYNSEDVSQPSPNTPTSERGPVEDTNHEKLGDSQGTPVKLRSLDEIYRETEPIQLNYSNMCLIGIEELTNFNDAEKDKNWNCAMVEEIKSIQDNKTWSLIEPVQGHKVIGFKWMFKLKKDYEGKIRKYKARLVAKGYVQQQGVDFEEVFAFVARMETVRMIMVIAVQQGWSLHHMNVKCAFLNGELNEEVYITQPPGFLKQTLRAWNSNLDSTLKSMNFERRQLEHAVYRRKKGEWCTLVGVYVDDLVITWTCELEIVRFKSEMMEKFKMSDLGLLTYYLGIEVRQKPNMITLCWEGFAQKILKECGMDEYNPTQTPMKSRLKLNKNGRSPPVDQTRYRSIVGSLRYLLHTRPDLAKSVRFLFNAVVALDCQLS
jgi:Reverse transcriptase (RNA-dependent DNA polymerase)